MRLKRLELFGFKSFADRTLIDFGDNRLVGIVGPNGCGKSNVVDAVRWVLGETRPTSMRGAGMTDVIFKGSASRPPLSVAEVTLVLDNREGELEGFGAEVGITRRLYKSGEGEYLVDGERVRLKDVRELLFDTGLGSRGYSVLEQGRIDAVLSANPLQRRAVFEEAAGISRYRQRRHETELRLKRVEQDVARLEDVMGELRTRARSLRIQAGKAERFLSVRAEWAAERTRYLRHRLAALDGELGALSPELERLEAELVAMREERAACEEETDAREAERTTVVAELDRVSSEAGALSGELRALDERRSQLAMRVASWRASAGEESERARTLGEQLAQRRDERERMAAELGELRGALERAEAAAGGLTGRARELGRRYKEARRAAAEQNESVLARLHEKTASQNSVRHLEAARGPAEARLARAAERVVAAGEALAAARADALAAAARWDSAGAARAEQEAEHAALRAELDGAERALEDARSEHAERRLERASLAATIESLLDRDAERAGLAEGTRRVLEAAGNGASPCDPAALQGILADHVRVDFAVARALDAVLGDRAQALVASHVGAARDVLRWLREARAGQGSVVLPAGLAAQAAATPLEPELAGAPGVEGRLADRVACDAPARPLVEALVGDVVLTADVDAALELVRRFPHRRFVTASGELVDRAGVSGGALEVTHGPVGRRSQAAELERRAAAVDARLEELAEELAARTAARDGARRDVDAALERRDAARRAEAELDGLRRTAEARLADQEAARGELEAEDGRARGDIARLEADLAAAVTERARAEEAFAAENARLGEMEEERRVLEDERETLAREEGRAHVERTRLSGEVGALERLLEDTVGRIAEDQAEIARAEGRSRNYLANAEQGERDGEALAQEIARVAARRGELEQRLEELRELERTGAERIREVRGRAERVQRALDAAAEELSERKLRAQRLELAREELSGRAREELDLSPQDLRADFEPDPELARLGAALEELERRVVELKGTLDNLGPVNTEAVAELEEVQGRLTFLESQAEDLARARRSLNEAIAKIDGESRRLFLETFEEVRANFQRIFRQLFGGGRADVRLDEGVDVLDAGIDIVARPPGREMLSIGLLSGGQRTLTALALLFAVFEARPSPFCVLDEVDAALDDANIERFLGMLEGFLESTQFLVVTHNKGTMSACEALYGVTMQVKGVSRYVAVELDEVDEFAPEATGHARPPRADGASAPPSDEPPARADQESGERVVEIVPASRRPTELSQVTESAPIRE